LTTIAVTRKEIACDLQFTGEYKFKGKTKIYEPTAEVCKQLFGQDYATYIGFAGKAFKIAEAVAYLASDASEKTPRLDISGIALTSNQRIFMSDNFAYWYEIGQDYIAIGSGAAYAMAALGEGASPLEACKIASKYDANTGMGYLEYTF
jgi:hypothetical protein